MSLDAQRRPAGWVDYTMLVAMGAIWGSSFMFIKVVVGTVPAVPATVLRLIVTTAMMLALLRWMGERLPPWGPIWRVVAVSAVVGNVLPFLLIAWGEERVDGSLAAILMAPMPLVAALLAHALLRDEKLTAQQLAGIGLGMVGVVVLMGLDQLTRLGDDTVRQLAVLAAGCCYAIGVVVNRGLTGGSGVANVTAVMLASMLAMAPLGLMTDWSFSPSRASLAAIVVLAVFSTGVGTLLQFKVIGRQGAAFSAQVNFLVPVFGTMWGALVLAERPSMRSLAGLALILAGVAISSRGRASAKR